MDQVVLSIPVLSLASLSVHKHLLTTKFYAKRLIHFVHHLLLKKIIEVVSKGLGSEMSYPM